MARAGLRSGRPRPRRRPPRLEAPRAVRAAPARARSPVPGTTAVPRGLLALAFAGGILPSPTALVVLLGSVSIGRTGLGLVLIAAFSVSLALSLVAVGALAIRARHVATERFPAGLMRLAPVVSAGCIALVLLVLTARGLVQV